MTDAHKQLQIADLELPPKRGRPKSGNALPNSEKQRRYRERQKASGVSAVSLNHEELCIIQGLLTAVSGDDIEVFRLQDIKKMSGTQLDPLRIKLARMVNSALDKAYAASVPGKPRKSNRPPPS
jgi:hypothetical protein